MKQRPEKTNPYKDNATYQEATRMFEQGLELSTKYKNSADVGVQEQGRKLYEQCEILKIQMSDLISLNRMPQTRLQNIAKQTNVVRQITESLLSQKHTERNLFQKGVMSKGPRQVEQPLMASQRKPIEPR